VKRFSLFFNYETPENMTCQLLFAALVVKNIWKSHGRSLMFFRSLANLMPTAGDSSFERTMLTWLSNRLFTKLIAGRHLHFMGLPFDSRNK